jgi:MFS family permease
MLIIALPFYVLQLTGSPAAVSTVVASGLLGNLVFGSFAGAYVDRWDRKRVVVTVNVLQCLVLLPLLLVDQASRVWIVAVVAFASAGLTQFFQPAENALLPSLVATEQLTAANSLNALNNNTGRLIGPAMGGIAFATVGLSGAALADAASFAVAGLLCALITGSHRASDAGERRHLLRELAEGLKTVATNRIVRAIFVLIGVTSIGEGMMSTLFAVYVKDAMHAGGREMGWMMSAQAVGGILGALLGTRYAAKFPPIPLIATGFAFFGLVDIVIFNYPRWDTTLWPVLVLFVIVGLPAGVFVGVIWTLFQTHTPNRLRGRAFSIIWLGGSVAGILGAVVAGALGGRYSAVDLLTVQGAGCVLGGLLFPVLAAGRSKQDRPAALVG